jgi:hypothetical protein
MSRPEWETRPVEVLAPVPYHCARARLGNAVRASVRAALIAVASSSITASLLVGLHIC